MVDRSVILKTFDSILLKCSPSDKIRKLGKGVVVERYYTTDGDKVTKYVYDDDISIEFVDKHVRYNVGDEYNPTYFEGEVETFTNVSFNGKTYPVLSYGTELNNADEFFKHQKEQIIQKYGDEGWEFYKEYANEFGTYQGWNLNSILRGKRSRDEVTDEDGDFYISPFLLNNHDRFVEMEKSLSLDNEDFVSVRIMGELHRNDSIGKLIVSDKGHTCSSIIGERSHYDTYANPDSDWFVLTLNEAGSGVKGGYLGSAIEEFDGYDFEREVNYVPGQRFERLVIDEANKLIIQRPLPLED